MSRVAPPWFPRRRKPSGPLRLPRHRARTSRWRCGCCPAGTGAAWRRSTASPAPWTTWEMKPRRANGPDSWTSWKPTSVGFTSSRTLPCGRGQPGMRRPQAPGRPRPGRRSGWSARWPRWSGTCAIPQQAFADLIRANRQDQVVTPLPVLQRPGRLLHALGQPGGPDRAARLRGGHPGADDPLRPGLHRAPARRALAGRGGGFPGGPHLPAGRGHGTVRVRGGRPRGRHRRTAAQGADGVRGGAGPRSFSTKAPLWWGICTDLRGLPWPVTWRAAGPRWPRSPRPDMTCCARPTSRAAAGWPGKC